MDPDRLPFSYIFTHSPGRFAPPHSRSRCGQPSSSPPPPPCPWQLQSLGRGRFTASSCAGTESCRRSRSASSTPMYPGLSHDKELNLATQQGLAVLAPPPQKPRSSTTTFGSARSMTLGAASRHVGCPPSYSRQCGRDLVRYPTDVSDCYLSPQDVFTLDNRTPQLTVP